MALLFALTATLLAVLVHAFGGSGPFFAAVRGASANSVALAFGIALVCVLLGAERWRIVLSAMGYTLPYRRSLEVVLAAWPLVVVTPSRTNEFLRALAIRDRVPLASGAGSVLAEKVMDVFVLLGLACAGAALHGFGLVSALLGLGMLSEIAVVAAVVKNRKLLGRLPFFRTRTSRLEQLFAAFEALLHAPFKLAALGAVSLTIRLFTISVTYVLLVAVGAHVGWLDTLALWPLATLIGLVPVTVAGMGTRDAAFIYLLKSGGQLLARPAVLAATMGYSVIAVWSFALLGLPFMLRETVFRAAERT